jgi:hypothetical protein
MGAPYSAEGPWRQEHSCGCESRVDTHAERVTLTLCPLHEAAEEMADALLSCLPALAKAGAADAYEEARGALMKAGVKL